MSYLTAIRHILLTFNFWIGAVCAALALLGGVLETTLGLPSSVWLAIALLIMFWAMVEMQRKLDAVSSPAGPTMKLVDLVVYATNNPALIREGHTDDVDGIDRVLKSLRDLAGRGVMQAWGRTFEAMHEDPNKPLSPIPNEHWQTHEIETLEFCQDTDGATQTPGEHVGYVDIYVDAEQAKRHFKPAKVEA